MKNLLVVAAICLAVTLNAQAAAEVSADHSDAMYSCGEKAVFTVKITDSAGQVLPTGVVSVVIDNFGPAKQFERKVDLASGNPFTVEGSLSEPGFLRVTLKGAGIKGDFPWSVGYEPDRIRAMTPVPDDFDEFWTEARRRLAAEVPLDPQVVRIDERSTKDFDFYRISFATFGRRVYGYMSVPTDKSLAPYPVALKVAAAGFGGWTNNMSGDPKKINVFFSVYPFEPHWDWEKLGLKAKYDEMNKTYAKRFSGGSYPSSGFGSSREDCFYYPVVLGIDRAIDWLAARPDVNREAVTYQGTSQGGGMGLILTGLNKRIRRAVFYVPAITDTLAGTGGRQSGWPRPVENQKTDEAKEMAKRVAPYFDGASFATRITCSVRFAVGLADTTCAPHCTWAAFNAIASADKRLFYGIGMGHGCRGEFYSALGTWVAGPMVRQPLVVTQTFDDNPKDHATVVRPLLDKYGWKGIFNFVTGWVSTDADRLTWDDVRGIAAAGHEVANHSLTHPNFGHLLKEGNTNEVRRQIRESQAVFRKELGRSTDWFCYPGNWANDFTRRLVAEAGMGSLACRRPNFGCQTPPQTERGVYVHLLNAFAKEEKSIDLMVHGTRRGKGWLAFDDSAQFERHLQEIQALEREGFVRVLPYSEAHASGRR